MMFVHKNTRHVSYSKQLWMKLGCVGKGQEGQPGIVALKLEVIIPSRNEHRQLVVVSLFTSSVPYFAPHAMTRF